MAEAEVVAGDMRVVMVAREDVDVDVECAGFARTQDTMLMFAPGWKRWPSG